MKAFKFGIWAAFTIIVLVFFVALIGQNTETMSFTLFMHTSNDYPKWAVLIGCILLGGFLSSLFFIIELVILETKNLRLNRLNRKLERALRNVEEGHVPASGNSGNNGQNLSTALISPSGPSIGPSGLGSMGQISPDLEEDV